MVVRLKKREIGQKITHVTTGGPMLVLISRSSAATGYPFYRECSCHEHAYSIVCHVMLALHLTGRVDFSLPFK